MSGMRLSELYGRIGQILKEEGDMRVGRYMSLKVDGIRTNLWKDDIVEYDNSQFHLDTITNDDGKVLRKTFIIEPLL